MKIRFIASYVLFLNFTRFVVNGTWYDQLNDFDILPDINIRITRSTINNRNINFNTKYRSFNLILKPTEDLFTNDFQSVNIDELGRRTPVQIDFGQYYEGFVSGSYKSSVRAFLGNNKMYSINIMVDNDIFKVESLSRYEKSNSSLIVYRFSDLKINHTKSSFCPSKNVSESNINMKERMKRSAESQEPILSPTGSVYVDSKKKFCTLKLVADYRFNLEHGKGDIIRTHNYLIELIDNINQLFKNTEFVDSNNKKYLGYGFIIKEINVHSNWTYSTPGHYNGNRGFEQDAWQVEELLNSFGEIDHNDVCLAHLFTYQSFSEGTLGLAWIATWKTLGNGGICSERVPKSDNKYKSVNTAWSTYKDAVGNHLVSLSAYLVTAHELGHNWGADHDPDTTDCSPNAKGGGKYVMYTYSVVGYEKNNRIFSPCSRRSIGATIATRGEYCFKSKDKVVTTLCGNSRIDENEDCDLGRNQTNDNCCQADCRFRPGAQCSPRNHECCTSNCKVKQRGEICAFADPYNPCLDHSICDGFDKVCPPAKQLTGPNCTEHGHCYRGKCRPYCEIFDKEACICDKIEEACLICCRDRPSKLNYNTIQECQPATQFQKSKGHSYLRLNEGRPCAQGVCENGVCKRRVNKLVERVWKIIDNFNTNLFAAFLFDNLVGTVIILSLLIWIPASIMVSCHDAKHRKLLIHERNLRRPQVAFTDFVAT